MSVSSLFSDKKINGGTQLSLFREEPSNSRSPSHRAPQGKPLEETTNFFNWLIFGYISPIMSLGYKRPLEASDLHPLRESFSSHNASKVFQRFWREERKQPKPSLAKAINKSFLLTFWLAGMLKSMADACTIASPMVLQLLVQFVIETQTASDPPPAWHGFALAAGIFALQQTNVTLLQIYFKGELVWGQQL